MKIRYSILLLAASLLLTGCDLYAQQSTAEEISEADLYESEPESDPESDSGTTQDRSNDRGGMRDLLDYFSGDNTDKRPDILKPENDPSNRNDRTTVTTTTTDEAELLQELSQLYTLTVDSTGLVSRSRGKLDDDTLTWVIEANGRIQLERNAKNEFTYRPMDYGPGIYRVWLKGWLDGYEVVSNTLEFESPYSGDAETPAEDEQEGFESWRIRREKGHMKHLIQNLGDTEYKLGFIIDPDHDGVCNAVVYYANADETSEPHQNIFENLNMELKFDSQNCAAYFGMECRLGIWCDPETKTDYIVALTEDGKAYDCYTLEELPDFDPEAVPYFYYFTANTTSDRDHFYVSYQGKPVWENA